MASATPDDFLSGQGVPVALSEIETELSRLWGPAAEQVGGPELARPSVTRIVLANLVVMAPRVVGDCGTSARAPSTTHLQQVLDTVAAQFPSRAIVVRRTEEPGRSLRAEVSALCHLPAPGLPQVCSERIVLCAGVDAVDLVPGAIRPLLEADLPFALWWTDDPRRDEALFRDLADECTRLILDLPDPGTDPAALRVGLDPSICPFARDAAWFGVTRWRELIAQFFDPPCAVDTLERLERVRIDASVPSRGPGQPLDDHPPRLAIWLAAWLAGQLGWHPEGRPDRVPGALRAEFRGPGDRPVHVEILTDAVPDLDEPQIDHVMLTTRRDPGEAHGGGPESFRLMRAARSVGKVRIEVDSPSHCALPRMVVAPELDAAHRIAAALESSRNDPPFQHALAHALWLMEE